MLRGILLGYASSLRSKTGQSVHYPAGYTLYLKIRSTRHFDGKVSGMVRLEKDAPAALDELRAFEAIHLFQ